MSVVLDASAALAYLHQEPGWEAVRSGIGEASIGAVNWSEVAQKTTQQGLDIELARALLSDVGLEVVPFSANQAEIAAKLWEKTRRRGLSLADRACLALAIEKKALVLTADRAWASLALGVEIQAVR